MTILIAWREDRTDRAWIVSDSRLSRAGEVGRVVLTDHAAKILEIPVGLYDLQSQNGPAIKAARLGFAYTGSMLVALQTYAAVVPLWSRLCSSEQQALPSIHQFAEHLSIFLGTYAKEVGAAGGDFRCECVLIGYDVATAAPDGWSIKTNNANAEPELRRLKLDRSDSIEILGSGTLAAQEAFPRLCLSDPRWKQEPLTMIRAHLSGETAGDVGGGVQLGQVSEKGFELFFDVRPLTCGGYCDSPIGSMYYRGFDMFDITRIGHAFTTLTGVG